LAALTLRDGIQLFNQRQFFHCHEVLEEQWMPQRGPRRMFLQSLIHIAVGLYHWQCGNRTGAAGQIRKGLHKIAPFLPLWEGVDTGRLYRDAAYVLAVIETGAGEFEYPQIHFAPDIAAS
jgi:hypothetical protein